MRGPARRFPSNRIYHASSLKTFLAVYGNCIVNAFAKISHMVISIFFKIVVEFLHQSCACAVSACNNKKNCNQIRLFFSGITASTARWTSDRTRKTCPPSAPTSHQSSYSTTRPEHTDHIQVLLLIHFHSSALSNFLDLVDLVCFSYSV